MRNAQLEYHSPTLHGFPVRHVRLVNISTFCDAYLVLMAIMTLPMHMVSKFLPKYITLCFIYPQVDGILVQSPLPEGISEYTVFNSVAPEKDVDAFHILNMGE